LGLFSKKPQKTGLAGMAHPPFGRISLKRDGFLALNEFSGSGRTKKGVKNRPEKVLSFSFSGTIF
jgi:hypothetical protein